MCVCMYVCMYVCVRIYVGCTYKYICMEEFGHVYTYMFMSCVTMYVCIHVWTQSKIDISNLPLPADPLHISVFANCLKYLMVV
jgi:hypothetical protein